MSNPTYYLKNFEFGGKYNMVLKLDTKGINYGSIKYNYEGVLISEKGQKIREKYLDYVVLNDGSIIFGERHSFLSGGKNVVYAGGVEIDNNGKIKYWNCFSGHYQPDKSYTLGKSKVIDFFKGLGVSLNDNNFTGSMTSYEHLGF